MKITDYAPRAAPFDSYLKGRDLVGVEVGVDVGAHAEALLAYCPVAMLNLVDPWPNPYCRGYCEGRLARFRPRFTMNRADSHNAARSFSAASLDFVYVDQEHDAEAVASDLAAWFPLLKRGGMLGYRNYTARATPLDRAIDAFVKANRLEASVADNEIVVVKP